MKIKMSLFALVTLAVVGLAMPNTAFSSESVTTVSLVSVAHADGLVEPTSPEQALGLIPQLLTAVKTSNWGVVVSIVLMLTMWVLRFTLFKSASASLVRFLTALFPVVGLLAGSLYSGQPIGQAFLSALFMGAAATGLWEWVGQHVLPAPVKPAV